MRSLSTLATLLVGLAVGLLVLTAAPQNALACHKGTPHGADTSCGGGEPPPPDGTSPVLVDSDDPPKAVGVAVDIGSFSAQVAFDLDGETYIITAHTFPFTLGPQSGSLLFPNATCTEPGYLDQGDSGWPSIESSAGIPTIAGVEFWVQDGAPTAGFLALSRTDEGPPFGCTTSAQKGIPRDTGAEVIPMRYSGIILEDEFPPPYDVINWPTLP